MNSFGRTLETFTNILRSHDPAGVTSSAPDDEYSPEALSILSRFVESGLQAAENPEAVKQVSEAIVSQALEFWFNENPPPVEEMSSELVAAYLRAFESEEG